MSWLTNRGVCLHYPGSRAFQLNLAGRREVPRPVKSWLRMTVKLWTSIEARLALSSTPLKRNMDSENDGVSKKSTLPRVHSQVPCQYPWCRTFFLSGTTSSFDSSFFYQPVDCAQLRKKWRWTATVCLAAPMEMHWRLDHSMYLKETMELWHFSLGSGDSGSMWIPLLQDGCPKFRYQLSQTLSRGMLQRSILWKWQSGQPTSLWTPLWCLFCLLGVSCTECHLSRHQRFPTSSAWGDSDGCWEQRGVPCHVLQD